MGVKYFGNHRHSNDIQCLCWKVSIWTYMSNISESLPDLSLGLGVDSEDELCAHVGFHGGRDDHILSRLQTVILNQIPCIGVILICFHRPVFLKEERLQASFWCLKRIWTLFNVTTLLPEHQNALFTEKWTLLCMHSSSVIFLSYPWWKLLDVKWEESDQIVFKSKTFVIDIA